LAWPLFRRRARPYQNALTPVNAETSSPEAPRVRGSFLGLDGIAA
jgi:hypothetical protein